MKTKHINILKIYIEKLNYFNYSNHTIDIYYHYVEKFLYTVNKYAQHLTGNDFQEYLNNFDFSSISQQNQIISAIKFLYEKVLNRKYNKIDFQRPRKEKKLPKVIDKEYLINTINNIKNIKHKTIIQLAFSVGLRVSEVINLKLEDIDSKRMIIYINNAKGNKDRIVPLSKPTLILIEEYKKKESPKLYLFNGQKSLQYSSTSCNKIVKKYLGKEYRFHTLRHSSFTALLESGVDISLIQKIAGHSSPKTTQIYIHISNKLLQSIELPI